MRLEAVRYTANEPLSQESISLVRSDRAYGAVLSHDDSLRDPYVKWPTSALAAESESIYISICALVCTLLLGNLDLTRATAFGLDLWGSVNGASEIVPSGNLEIWENRGTMPQLAGSKRLRKSLFGPLYGCQPVVSSAGDAA